ncbi:ATP-binding protein [Streptomyces sp. NBC_00385]|uniref:ATP-binding protein n=1 Tax=Streptomyces sp. NBC_00385 TaxID=2975733 RepID=UPI002DDBB994|nr:ATP-binding protein [Streptomyces sp. NBC_00385]WRZ03778.1 ATP-binding protein [Streptomyces sp. NBC_00385]
MDPIHRGPEEFGHDGNGFSEEAGRRRPSRDPLTPDFSQQTPQQARIVPLISGDLLLTVNPVDGSEVEPCPPGEQPAAPVRRTPAERADRERAAAPPVPPGPPVLQLPLLQRADERERLVRLLARGRSVRLTGPAGSGRTALLEAVATDCAELAPDGVVRLSGHKRTVADLLHGLFEAVHDAPLHRPDRELLLEKLRTTGAVVVLDDLEFGGAALDELLDATPECAFLLAATPDVAAPGPDSHLEEVFLAGLDRGASIDLMERVVERTLTEEEANWAGDLWFESEGLPLRFVQAGALLRQRDLLSTDPTAYDEYGYLENRPVEEVPEAVESAGADADEVPLPSLGEGAAPAALLGSRLSEAARDTLRFAVALGGEVPHQAHLPALVGDTHADAALAELAGCGLLSPAGSRYRLAAGVLAQLEAAGYGDDATDRARTVAQHYAWWAGHPSVTPARVVAESDAMLAAMAQLVPGDGAGQTSVAVLLARSASPAFAAGLHWSAWEKSLRIGQEAGRIAGEVAEEAYFHHELGVLALCTGNLDRARAELETSISMRGALADKSGAVAGRRALALVEDRSGRPAAVGAPVMDELPVDRFEVSPPRGLPTVIPVSMPRTYPEETAVASRQGAPKAAAEESGRFAMLGGARRNLVAAGAGVLLAGVLGTVVTLGLTSNSDPQGDPGASTEQSVTGSGDQEEELPAEESTDGATPSARTSGSASSSATPGPSVSGSAPAGGSGASSPGATASESAPSSPGGSSSSRPSPTRSTTKPTVTPTSPSPASPSPTDTETSEPPTEPTPTGTETTEPAPTVPDSSDSASGPSKASASPSVT